MLLGEKREKTEKNKKHGEMQTGAKDESFEELQAGAKGAVSFEELFKNALEGEERQAALVLSKAVFYGEEMIKNGIVEADTVLTEMRRMIEAEPLAKIDYVEMVNADSIEKIEKAEGNVLIAVAVWIGTTRLIDNFIIEV